MKLYLLRPKEPYGDIGSVDGDPWKPLYDKCFGFVIRAEDEQRARQMADDEAGDENDGEFMGEKTANTLTPWLDDKYSTCTELTANGEEELVVMDYHKEESDD